jgi:hypothetical protein
VAGRHVESIIESGAALGYQSDLANLAFFRAPRNDGDFLR